MSRAYTLRPRSVPPEIVTDHRLDTRCSLLASNVFFRLIFRADDQGRLVGIPQVIRGHLFPNLGPTLSVDDVDQALDELVAARLIARYQVDGDDFIQLLDWWGWEGGMKRKYASRYPPPEGWLDRVTAGPSDEA